MFRHKNTGTIFRNRKDAVILMGESRYKRFLKNEEFEFITTEEKDNK